MVAATSLSSPSLARAICTAAATSSPLPAQHASASSVQPPVIINSGLPPSETKKDWGNFVKEKFESVGQLKSSQVLLELARSRNKIPLPKSIAPPGSIPLPPEQDTLLSQNYQLLPPLKAPTQVEETEEDDNEEVDTNPANPNPNYFGQDQRDTEQQQPLPHTQSQRVSFQLNAVAAAAAKRPRMTIDPLNMG